MMTAESMMSKRPVLRITVTIFFSFFLFQIHYILKIIVLAGAVFDESMGHVIQ